MCWYRKKCEITTENINLVAQGFAYFWSEPQSVDEEVFQKFNERDISRLYRRFPSILTDPLNYFQEAFLVFDKYSDREKEWLAQSDPDIWKCNARDLEKVLSYSLELPIGVYMFYALRDYLVGILDNFRRFHWKNS